jgi:hypothetical protein
MPGGHGEPGLRGVGRASTLIRMLEHGRRNPSPRHSRFAHGPQESAPMVEPAQAKPCPGSPSGPPPLRSATAFSLAFDEAGETLNRVGQARQGPGEFALRIATPSTMGCNAMWVLVPDPDAGFLLTATDGATEGRASALDRERAPAYHTPARNPRAGGLQGRVEFHCLPGDTKLVGPLAARHLAGAISKVVSGSGSRLTGSDHRMPAHLGCSAPQLPASGERHGRRGACDDGSWSPGTLSAPRPLRGAFPGSGRGPSGLACAVPAIRSNAVRGRPPDPEVRGRCTGCRPGGVRRPP